MWRAAIEVPAGAELDYKLVHVPAASAPPRWEEAANHTITAALHVRSSPSGLHAPITCAGIAATCHDCASAAPHGEGLKQCSALAPTRTGGMPCDAAAWEFGWQSALGVLLFAASRQLASCIQHLICLSIPWPHSL